MCISTFDAMARGISSGQGGICAFDDCLGDYLAVGSDGGIYSCNRFAHHPEWRLGDVRDQPSLDTLAQSPTWQHLRQRELTVHEDCGDCLHFNYAGDVWILVDYLVWKQRVKARQKERDDDRETA